MILGRRRRARGTRPAHPRPGPPRRRFRRLGALAPAGGGRRRLEPPGGRRRGPSPDPRSRGDELLHRLPPGVRGLAVRLRHLHLGQRGRAARPPPRSCARRRRPALPRLRGRGRRMGRRFLPLDHRGHPPLRGPAADPRHRAGDVGRHRPGAGRGHGRRHRACGDEPGAFPGVPDQRPLRRARRGAHHARGTVRPEPRHPRRRCRARGRSAHHGRTLPDPHHRRSASSTTTTGGRSCPSTARAVRMPSTRCR